MANRRFIDFPIASTSSDTDIILIWQDGLNKQTTKATLLSGLPEDLEDLNDVVISGLTNGQILRYNSTTGVWENTDQGNLDLNDLNDVTIVSPSNGQVLVYNSSTSKWENSSGGYVPYVGAVTTVNLGSQQLIAGQTTLTTNGSTDTLTVNHTSGSGKAINVIKGGNGEGLYIDKTSGSGNAATIVGTLEATTLVKTGGTSSQFLKADGSVDSTSYGTGTVTSVGLSSATSGVTIGSTPVTTSGTITLSIATASGTQNGLLSSTDWTTFNNKQNALTNPVTGTGTTNYLPKFTGSTTIGNSQIFDNGTNVGINTNTPLSTNLLGALTIVKSYSSDTPASTTAQTYYTNQSGLFLFGRNSGLTIVGANNEENQIIFANTSTVAFASINTGTGSNSTGGDMYFKVGSNTEAMRIFATTRNVHIGPTPATDNGARLQVSGTARISGSGSTNLVVERTGSNGSFMQLLDGSGNSVFLGDNNGDFLVQTPSGGFSNKLVISNAGAATFSSSVGVGVSPSALLHLRNGNTEDVSGSIIRMDLSGINPFWEIQARNGGDSANRKLVFFTSVASTDVMTLTQTGNVLIGTTTDAAGVRLRVEGGAIRSLSTYDNTSATAANLVVSASGTFERSTSSLKYKKEVRDYDKGLEVLKNMRPVYYKGKSQSDGNKQFAGLIAEEIHELGLNEFVQYANDGSPDALAYTHMVAILINSIKELKQEIDTLKN